MLSLIIENINFIVITVFGSIIFFCLVQFYYDINIKYLYISIIILGCLLIYIYLSKEILYSLSLYINDNTKDIKVKGSDNYNLIIMILNNNYLLHIIILYLILCLLILILSNKVVKNNSELILLKNIFVENIQKLGLKGLKITSKSNDFFIILCSLVIIISLLCCTYFSYFILDK